MAAAADVRARVRVLDVLALVQGEVDERWKEETLWKREKQVSKS